MQFGRVDTPKAQGCLLAHSLRVGEATFKKGRRLSEADVSLLLVNSITQVVAARLGPDDVPEDEAAHALAMAIAGQGVASQQAFTGRANAHASTHGLLVVDAERVTAINRIHESLTIATLRPHAVVRPRQMVATVKVIPFAVPRDVLEKALAIVHEKPLMHVRLFQRKKVGLVVTTLPHMKQALIEKSERAMAERLEAFGVSLHKVAVVPHDEHDVARAIIELKQAGCDCLLLFGASAIVDRADVIPAAVVSAGGKVLHLGMPVDPGNLLMLGEIGSVPVLGVPSCARSPKRNGFDWVLERILSGIVVLPEDIMEMGVGGLLAEIPSRPSPRESAIAAAPKVTAIILAAGLGSRMGGGKMLAEIDGKPMLRVVVENIAASSVDGVVVVTGHDSEKVETTLRGLNVRCVYNPDFAQGLATSLRVGVEAAGQADAVVVCLGDMPRVSPAIVDKLIAAFNPVEHRSIVVPTHLAQSGNPVLWGSEHFTRLVNLSGDKGARKLLAELAADLTEVEADAGVLLDADTPEALAKLKSVAGS